MGSRDVLREREEVKRVCRVGENGKPYIAGLTVSRLIPEDLCKSE